MILIWACSPRRCDILLCPDSRQYTMSGSSLATAIHRISGASQQPHDDLVAIEEPLEIRLGHATSGKREDSSVSITMRTPGSDAELAIGFLYTEAIIKSAADIALVKHCGPPAPDTGSHNVIRVELEPGVDVDLERLQRHFYTTSSCGVCGKTSLDALRTCGAADQPLTTTRFSKAVLTALPDRLRAAQKTFAATGGLHAAAAFDTTGNLVACHEDIGRHNAVDKVIGELLSRGLLPATWPWPDRIWKSQLRVAAESRDGWHAGPRCGQRAVQSGSRPGSRVQRDADRISARRYV